MRGYPYAQMDVFTDTRLCGNGLAVVFCEEPFSDDTMLSLAREFRQFETIYVRGFRQEESAVEARIFTADGELPFAGHPVLGAAAALHARHRGEAAESALTFELPDKRVPTVSVRTDKGWRVRMRQGKPVFLGELPQDAAEKMAAAFSLTAADLHPTLPAEVVSTGLPYLLLPVRGCLGRARIAVPDLEQDLAAVGASYCYLFDADTSEARTWDNAGACEDAATGSAAGPACAYLVRHGRLGEGETVTIRQGLHAHRPSVLTAWQRDGEIFVAGDVVLFAEGVFRL